MVRKSGFPEDILFGGKGSPGNSAGGVEDSLLRPYLRVLALKDLYRQGWLKRGVPRSRCESVADHAFGTAVLVLFTAGRPPFSDADPGKACRMAVIHELGEVYAGDITPVDGVSKEEKYALERASILRVLKGFPVADEILALWEEFEEGRTPEARLVRRLDRLEMGVQAAAYRGEGFPGMEEFLESARRAVGDGPLGDALARAESARGE